MFFRLQLVVALHHLLEKTSITVHIELNIPYSKIHFLHFVIVRWNTKGKLDICISGVFTGKNVSTQTGNVLYLPRILHLRHDSSLFFIQSCCSLLLRLQHAGLLHDSLVWGADNQRLTECKNKCQGEHSLIHWHSLAENVQQDLPIKSLCWLTNSSLGI